jgi:hypothetical protein
LAYVIHLGFEGSQVLLGVTLGFWGAHTVATMPLVAQKLDSGVEFIPLLWYTAGATVGYVAFVILRRPVFAIMCPLFGAHLVASTAGVLAARYLGDSPNATFFPAKDEAWVDVAASLMGSDETIQKTVLIQCGCAILASFLYRLCGPRQVTNSHYASQQHNVQPSHPGQGLALLLAAASVLGSAALIEKDLGCLPPSPHCLLHPRSWRWPLVGNLIKLVFASAAVRHQLGHQTELRRKELLDAGYSHDGYSQLQAKNLKSPLNRNRPNALDTYADDPHAQASTGCCAWLSGHGKNAAAQSREYDHDLYQQDQYQDSYHQPESPRNRSNRTRNNAW